MAAASLSAAYKCGGKCVSAPPVPSVAPPGLARAGHRRMADAPSGLRQERAQVCRGVSEAQIKRGIQLMTVTDSPLPNEAEREILTCSLPSDMLCLTFQGWGRAESRCSRSYSGTASFSVVRQ